MTILTSTCLHEWSERIAAFTPLVQPRLRRRWQSILTDFAARPGAGLSGSAATLAATKASYRFFENSAATFDTLHQGICLATASCLTEHALVLAIQDTTTAALNGLKANDQLGPYDSTGHTRGLLLHSVIAVVPDGPVVGLLHLQAWTRLRPGQPDDDRPLESEKWTAGIQGAHEALHTHTPDTRTQLLHITDSEGDCYETLLMLDDLQQRGIVRNCQNRIISGPHHLVHTALGATQPKQVKWLHLPKGRWAQVELRAVEVELLPDLAKYPHAKAMRWNVVEVREVDTPAGEQQVLWRLWTREAIDTSEECWRVVRLYKQRWRIEEVHLAFKSDCKAQRMQYETLDRLRMGMLTAMSVATRIVRLRDMAKTQPDAAASEILTDEEWRALWAYATGEAAKEQQEPPTVGQAVKWIARLGGHLNRNSDGVPGVRTLGKGLEALAMLVLGYRLGLGVIDATDDAPPEPCG